MSKKTNFILDRADFIELRKLIEDSPGIDAIDAAEARLREARKAFLKQRHELETKHDAILQAMALKLSNPRKLEAPAREYHAALFEWCKLTIAAFEDVHNAAVDEIDHNTKEGQFQQLVHQAENNPNAEGRDAAMVQIKAIQQQNVEPQRRVEAARRGRNAVQTAFYFATGRPMQEANVQAFVQAMDPLRGRAA